MTDPLTLAREVLALAAKATPGPWHQGPYYRCDVHSPHGNVGSILRGSSVSPMDERDAAFIAHVRTSAPALAQAVIEQAAELERWRSLHGADDPQDAIAMDVRGKEERLLNQLRAERASLEAENARLREAIVTVAEPMEVLHATMLDSQWMCDEVKEAVRQGVAITREAVAALTKGQP